MHPIPNPEAAGQQMFGTRRRTNDPAPTSPEWTTPTWEELVREHSDMVYRVALRLTGNPHDAEDLTQDVFVRAFRSIHDFEPGTLTGWLRRITTNLFLDQARRRQRIRFDPMAEAQERIEASAPGPAQTAIEATLDHDIARAMAELPPDVRVAVVLCDVEGLSYDEIATITDSSLATVRSRIQRGRSKLRTLLAHRRPQPGHAHVMGAPDELPGQARDLEPDAFIDEVLRR
ncbi:sigma-70 family RNA polymerase sigma factor [Aestuariimicrobium ganziense]|uniref:sigma-70 family RNA polymerase sigma factor n=1 Tax=Aestuariimicrobium ganziense TaxID=2773677 RepID=UPI002E2C4759|nr:sigma-70 family RNA polymerase sigma factor [Aestuariimicrobium ganziense]